MDFYLSECISLKFVHGLGTAADVKRVVDLNILTLRFLCQLKIQI